MKLNKQNIQILIEFIIGIAALLYIFKLGYFEKISSTNAINFIIEIWILSIIFRKANLISLIQKMADDIKNTVEKSDMDTLDAVKNYENVKKSIKDTPKLRDEIFQNAKNLALTTKQKIESDLNIKKDNIQSNLNDSYKNDEDKYKKLTTDEIYLASLDLAKDAILDKLDDKMQIKLINSALEEFDKVEFIFGGKS